MPPNGVKTSERRCVFCNDSEDNEVKYGQMHEYNGIVTHYFCLLLSSNMQQRGEDHEGILGFLPEDIQKELARGERLACAYCRKKGATLGCVNKKCKRTFHLPCGMRSNSLHQFFGQFKSFCHVHRPKQTIDVRVRTATPETLMCYICYDMVERDDVYKTLWAPCCKKNAWFHRDCVQQLALSAGYFFKCPLCNNNKEFHQAMQECGIFIPSQDASWELVPNAFHELLYRHNRCDAPKCLCPQGRVFKAANAKWELFLCQTCGSQGIHMACGKLKWLRPSWNCNDCMAILEKSQKGKKRVSRAVSDDETSSNEPNHEVGSSGSEVSVGRDSPFMDLDDIPRQSSLNLKPGPRCAKVRQLKQQQQQQQHQQQQQQQQQQRGETSAVASSSTSDIVSLVNNQSVQASDPLKSAEPTVSFVPTPGSTYNFQKKIDNDVIIVDSDDDTEVIKTVSRLGPSSTTTSGSLSMSIQITEVTSVPPEVFANVPSSTKSPIVVDLLNDDDPVPVMTRIKTYTFKRKADSQEILAEIIKRINDVIDSPDLRSRFGKKRKHDGVGENAATSTPQRRKYCVLRGAQGKPMALKTKNPPEATKPPAPPPPPPPPPPQPAPTVPGIDLTNSAIVRCAGQEYVLPLNLQPQPSAPVQPAAPLKDHRLNSDGDAGTWPAGEAIVAILASDSTSTAGSSRRGRRRRDNNGSRDNTHHEHPESGSGSRVDRNRLMKEKVLLKDLKFRVCSNGVVEMTIRDNYTINITADGKNVNNSFSKLHLINTRSSRVRGLRSSEISRFNPSVNLSRFDKASDSKLISNESISYLANGDRNGVCKYECNVAKENLVPDKHEQAYSAFGSLGSIEKRGKRLRSDDDKNNIEAIIDQDFIETASNISASTSRDSSQFCSFYSVNQRHYCVNNHSRLIKKARSKRRRSFATYLDKNQCCHVSIDLNRIQSFIKTNLLPKKQDFVKIYSRDDLINSTLSHNIESLGTLRRSKSESNISSLFLSAKQSYDDYFPDIDFINNSPDYHKYKKRKLIDIHGCVR